MENNQLGKSNLTGFDLGVFSPQNFEHSIRISQMLSKSQLVPDRFRGKVEDCMIALNMASRMKTDVMAVLQNMYIVYGNPSFSSKFLIALVNEQGRFEPLTFERDANRRGGSARAVTKDLKSGKECVGPWIDMEMAKAEGWVDKKGSKWKTMPELMLTYRAASFFVNTYCPEVRMGVVSTEEAYDIGAKPKTEDQEATVLETLNEDHESYIDILAALESGDVTVEDLKNQFSFTDQLEEELCKIQK